MSSTTDAADLSANLHVHLLADYTPLLHINTNGVDLPACLLTTSTDDAYLSTECTLCVPHTNTRLHSASAHGNIFNESK